LKYIAEDENSYNKSEENPRGKVKAMSFVRDSFLATFFWVVSIFNSFLKRQITSPMNE
jgi:hypothetical protein